MTSESTISPRVGSVHAVLLAILVCPVWAADTVPAFKLFVEEDGAYRVSFEDLGIAEDGIASVTLGLTVAGAPVPIWIEDGGDGLFGPGDWIEFVGEALRGEVSHFSEHSRFNVYVLGFDQTTPARMRAGARSKKRGKAARFRATRHIEHDRLLLRLPPQPGVDTEELWYWQKLAGSSQESFRQELDLKDLDRSKGGTVDLRVRVRGWSKPRNKPAGSELVDHRFFVILNGETIADVGWNGTDPLLRDIPSIPVRSFEVGSNTLMLEVPQRSIPEIGEELIDVVVLNWIEVDYPRTTHIGEPQAHFWIDEESRSIAPGLEHKGGEALLVYGALGSRWDGRQRDGRRETWDPKPGERSFVASRVDRLMSPSAIVSDEPSRLVASSNRADYIIIAHPRLIDAIEPLAEFHRSRGLEVEVVDIEDVYDEFNHGVLDPRAVRAFLGHAYRSWQKPAPRFVLLVGDASWDAKNSTAVDENYADWTYRPGEHLRFVKNGSTPYPTNADLNHRGLMPTWNHNTYEGHSASDNFFVAIDGDDYLPDMAIGRLPVVEPEEVSAIVKKTIRYFSAPEVGPWRRSALFITNESQGMQRQSDRLAGLAASQGLVPEKIYPAPSEASNEHHSERLVELFDQGQLVVHFLGHGGRYIWRTGPPDLEKNHDLFTLEHLDQLEVTDRLPVVLSLTCYSAPFDHPSADSIGEKLLRIEDRGAIAVVAASWRNSPSPGWSRALFEELAVPGATIGEAVQRAKRTVLNRMFVETYNLLGDPAVPMASPQGNIELRVAAPQDTVLAVSGTIDLDEFSGHLILDLIGVDGAIVGSTRQPLQASAFQVRLDRPEAEVHSVLAYAWSPEEGLDAAGRFELVPETPDPRRTSRRVRTLKNRAIASPKN